jgi:D-alanine transaminase
VLGLARTEGIGTIEKRFRLSTLCAAQEAFVTSTTLEVLPIVEVDGQRIGSGKPGPMTQHLASLFEQSTREAS